MIGFLGSVFSPHYFRAKCGHAPDDPIDFSAFNIALYGRQKKRWAFSERRKDQVERGIDFLRIGPNLISSHAPGEVRIEIDERSPIFSMPVRGTVRLLYRSLNPVGFHLDGNRRHRWRPIGLRATVEVNLSSPSVHFVGNGYMDTNFGDAPLEDDFVSWNWSRHILDEKTAVFYDGLYRSGAAFSLAVAADDNGLLSEIKEVPHAISLPSTRIWRCPRIIRTDAEPRVSATLENSPFYARSVVETEIFGERAVAMHESLSLERFVKLSTRWMVPFRLRRRK